MQTRGANDEALELYASAVGALATPAEIKTLAPSLRSRGVARDLAGVMHNFATCLYEASGDATAALQTLDQAAGVCGLVDDDAARDDCERRVDELRRYLGDARR